MCGILTHFCYLLSESALCTLLLFHCLRVWSRGDCLSRPFFGSSCGSSGVPHCVLTPLFLSHAGAHLPLTQQTVVNSCIPRVHIYSLILSVLYNDVLYSSLLSITVINTRLRATWEETVYFILRINVHHWGRPRQEFTADTMEGWCVLARFSCLA